MKDEKMKKLRMRIQREENVNDIFYEDIVGFGNGRYHYQVFIKDGAETVASPILDMHFYDGSCIDSFGVVDSDLLEIVRHRLQCFQEGEFRTRENACALTHIEEALMWMNKRKEDRKERSVLGTYNK